MELIVLAGGLGTRMRAVLEDVPKPMAEINGTPFLAFVLSHFQQEVSHFVLSVGHKYQVIRDYFGESFQGIPITYSIEEEPLGTGGGILQALQHCADEQVAVANGDTLFKVSLQALQDFHQQHQADLSLALKPLQDFDRYGTVTIDDAHRIQAFYEKQYCAEGLINGGVYILNKQALLKKGLQGKFSFEQDFMEQYYGSMRFYGKPEEAYFIDIGIPEDYERAQQELS